MKIFYISKYTQTPEFGNTSRQFMLSKYMNNADNKTTVIYSRSNSGKHKFMFKLFEKQCFDGVDCVKINGVLLKQMGINLRRIYSWIEFEINLFIYLISLPKSKRPDVVIASSFSLITFFTVGLLKKYLKYKMIIEVRDICPQTEIEFNRISKNSITYKVLRYVELYGYKKADKFFATMPKFDDYLIQQNIINPKFVCIPQGFDKDNYIDITSSDINEKFVVMYSGTIGEVNLVEELCICADFLKDHDDIEFVIYGDGPLKKYLKNKYSYLKNIKFKGWVKRSEIVKRLNEADLLINMWADKQVYNYGVSPNKWIDYMLAAKPILVTYNGYRSIINEADCGWFIEANNPELMSRKIIEISKMDKEKLKQIGENGRKFAIENLDYSVLGNKLINFITAD